MKRTIAIAIPVIVTLLLVACSGKGNDTQDGFTQIGETAISGDISITMDQGEIANYQARATFTIVNNGNSDLVIDPESTFIVKAESDGVEVKMELDKRTCGSKLIQGPVPAGGQVTGDVCWRGNATETWPALVLIGFNGEPGADGVISWKLEVEK